MMCEKMIEIAKHYGLEVQMRQTIEEMAELTKAISKYFRLSYREPQYVITGVEDNLIEEIADVHLMINQLVYLLGVEDEVVDIMNAKMDRTLDRIRGEEQ